MRPGGKASLGLRCMKFLNESLLGQGGRKTIWSAENVITLDQTK